MAKQNKLKKVKKETEVAKTEPTGGISGVVGLEADDINMPYVYLVRSGSKHAVKSDGKKAAAGSYFHSTKKAEYKTLEIIIAYAERGVTQKSDEDDTEVPVWRALCTQTSNMYSPFLMSFKGMSHWYGWRDLISLLTAEGITDIKSKVFKLTSKMATAGEGREYEVPVFEIVRDTTEDELAIADSMVARFSLSVKRADAKETVDDELKPNDDGFEIDIDEVIEELDK